MTSVESCDFATEKPDVSEEIVSQHLMEEYRPAGNNSQSSCLLQGTNINLICKGGNRNMYCSVGRIQKPQYFEDKMI